jgi:Kef-type K+ transport system membrane component KefB
MFSQIGVVILMFEVGLESSVRDVIAVGRSAVGVAAIGTGATFAAVFFLVSFAAKGMHLESRVFLATALTATSIGITARVLKDLGRTRSREARTILGAAVADDVIGLLLLALVSAWIKGRSNGGDASLGSVFFVIAKTMTFLALSVFVGVRVTPAIFSAASRLKTPGALLTTGVTFCFFYAWFASAIGLAPLVGAFAAGLVLDDGHSAKFVARGERPLSQLIEPISDWLVPVFFVVMGVRSEVARLLEPSAIALTATLAGGAILGKLACGLGSARGTNRLVVSIGMMPRGEVSLIFASLGTTLVASGAPLLGKREHAAIVAVVVITTLVAPPLLKWSFARAHAETARTAS